MGLALFFLVYKDTSGVRSRISSPPLQALCDASISRAATCAGSNCFSLVCANLVLIGGLCFLDVLLGVFLQGGALYTVSGDTTILSGITTLEGNTAVRLYGVYTAFFTCRHKHVIGSRRVPMCCVCCMCCMCRMCFMC